MKKKNKDGKTLLMELCYYNKFYVIFYYISHGANIYVKDNNGNAALSIAHSLNNKRVEEYLIEQSALWKFCNYSKNKK